MKPVKFPEATTEFVCPQVENCESLFAWTDGDMVISRWSVPFWERLRILIYGTVWVTIKGHGAPPPMALDGCRTVFEKKP